MKSMEFASETARGATLELRALASVALAKALQEPAEFPAQLPHLSALLLPERHVPRAVLRRGQRMNEAMPFAEFHPVAPLQHRVMASGLRPGLLERFVTRMRKRPALTPPGWIDATVRMALGAPDFLAQAQRTAYRGLRRRVFFGPGGPPTEPLSVAAFLTLIVLSGRPPSLLPQVWARLEDIARQAVDPPGWAGPMDRLVLTEARKALGRAEPGGPDMDDLGAGSGEQEIGDR